MRIMASTMPSCAYARMGETSHAMAPSRAAIAKLLTPASLCAHSRSSPITRPMLAAAATLAASSKVGSMLLSCFHLFQGYLPVDIIGYSNKIGVDHTTPHPTGRDKSGPYPQCVINPTHIHIGPRSPLFLTTPGAYNNKSIILSNKQVAGNL